MRAEAEIEKVLNDLDPDVVASGSGTRWPGMTFEQGVDYALRWALGWSDDHPLED